MNHFSERLKRILKILLELEAGQFISMEALAEQLQVSRRTVFREIDGLDALLSTYGVSLVSRPGKGIRLAADEKDRAHLFEALSFAGGQIQNKEDRRRLLLYELLQNPGGTKLIVHASRFQVSETTISNDVEALKPWLERFHLKTGRSGKVIGSEKDMRRAMSELIHESIVSEPVEFLKAESLYDKLFQIGQETGIMKLLNQRILHEVLEVFEEHASELGLDQYEQTSYISLIIHLVIAIERIEKGEAIVGTLPVQVDLSQAKALASVLEEALDLTFPPAEIGFIALHLQGARRSSLAFEPPVIQAKAESEAEIRDTQSVAVIANSVAAAYGEPLASLLASDPQYMQGLIAHLEPTLIRLEAGMPIHNPLYPLLKEQYGDLLDMTRQASKVLEPYAQGPISEDEVGYLTIHAGAAIERMNQTRNYQPIETGVLCASGIGTSAMMKARLERTFPGRMHLRTLSMAQQADLSGIQLLITSYPMPQSSVPTIQVSPLLNQQDLDKIEQTLNTFTWTPNDKTRNKDKFRARAKAIAKWSQSALTLAEGFTMIEADPNASINDLIDLAASYSQNDSELVKKALLRREQLGSVLNPDDGFGLLHAADPGINVLEYFILTPSETTFRRGVLENIAFMAVSLLPDPAESIERELLSVLNAGLITHDTWLNALKNHDEALAGQVMEDLMESINPARSEA